MRKEPFQILILSVFNRKYGIVYSLNSFGELSPQRTGLVNEIKHVL